MVYYRKDFLTFIGRFPPMRVFGADNEETPVFIGWN
jgi:hypothetical protein